MCRFGEGTFLDIPGGSEVKVSACNVGDLGSIPGSGRSPGEGNGNPLQYCCLENSMEREAWWAICSPWSRKVSDTTELLTLALTFIKDNHFCQDKVIKNIKDACLY